MSAVINKNLSLFRTIFYVLVILFLYFFLPPYLCFRNTPNPLKPLIIFYFLNITFVIYQFNKNYKSQYFIESKIQNVQEEINLLDADYTFNKKNNLALKAKIFRYNSLKEIIEELNRKLDIDFVAESMVDAAYRYIANFKGVCALYLLDYQNQRLTLFKTKKDNKDLVIKAKQGNIFDLWVLKHASPLIIEDIRKDFRFDLEKLKLQDLRPIVSLISAPFISEHKVLGLMSLDNEEPNYYNQEDLRFLAAISDLGTVALENSELFLKTQDLAIHDSLTGLFTKSYFFEKLKAEARRSLRHPDSFSILMLDIDFFKKYNDSFGHTAGDIVLKKISHIILDTLKEIHPTVCRFGGEEFCVILPGFEKDKASKTAEQIRKNIEKEKIILRRQETFVTVSIGIASFPDDGNEEDGLVKKADKNMYEAKRKGRNQICCI